MKDEKTFDEIIRETLSENIVIDALITLFIEKSESKEFSINEMQKQELKSQLLIQLALEKTESISLHLSGDDNHSIELDDEDYEKLSKLSHLKLQDYLTNLIKELSATTLENLRTDAKSFFQEEHDRHSQFKSRLEATWANSFRLLHMLLHISLEMGDNFNRSYRHKAVEEQDYVFDALVRLHSRGCLVTSEILVLLQNGFADGAYARWRSLYEIIVIANFIKQHGNKVAERYFLHSSITNFKELKNFQEHHQKLGFAPIPDVELREAEETYNQLMAKFGKGFSGDYGWATEVLRGKPTFASIEKNTALEYVRPFFKQASGIVHTSSKSLLVPFGLPINSDIMLAGSSAYGLSIPLKHTASAMLILSSTVLLSYPSFENIIGINVLSKIRDELFQEISLIENAALNDK